MAALLGHWSANAVSTATGRLVSELLTEHGKVAQPLIYEFAGDS